MVVLLINESFEFDMVPSCDNGIQNQDKEGIDCGGPCGDCATCQVDIPQGLRAQVGANSTALLEWDTVQNALQYTLRIRMSENSDWEVYETAATRFGVADLLPYRAYEWQVSAKCAESTSAWSDLCGFIANDLGSGNCAPEPEVLFVGSLIISLVPLVLHRKRPGYWYGYWVRSVWSISAGPL